VDACAISDRIQRRGQPGRGRLEALRSSRRVSSEQILADCPHLEPEDLLAVYAYAAELAAER